VSPFFKGEDMARKTKKKINKEVPEVVYIYDGENIQELAKEITGSSSKMWELLAYSGLSLSKLKKGDLLRWRI
jgi:hypothetical protein